MCNPICDKWGQCGKCSFSILRTAPLFGTAHEFCASRNGLRKSDFLKTVPPNSKVFWFTTMQEEKILARAIEI